VLSPRDTSAVKATYSGIHYFWIFKAEVAYRVARICYSGIAPGWITIPCKVLIRDRASDLKMSLLRTQAGVNVIWK
jgi:hypothetical protein